MIDEKWPTTNVRFPGTGFKYMRILADVDSLKKLADRRRTSVKKTSHLMNRRNAFVDGSIRDEVPSL